MEAVPSINEGIRLGGVLQRETRGDHALDITSF
jgi:hypothetical protein